MYNPKDVLTEDGFEEHKYQLRSLSKAMFWLTNNADDLHIGALDDKQLEIIYAMQGLLESGVLLNGDGEIEE